ncbi:MAG TPA: hypothetical protein VNT20_21370 [Flavisolibacter sp.]|jgi:hypothetical protein|nr:hypothetical protein [Flavisolibacter sp.]
MNSSANEMLINRTRVFETILSSPGMQENCKIVLNPTRQTIVVLARLIENGFEKKDENERDEILSFLPEPSLTELKNISEELLRKSGLVEFYEHMKQL